MEADINQLKYDKKFMELFSKRMNKLFDKQEKLTKQSTVAHKELREARAFTKETFNLSENIREAKRHSIDESIEQQDPKSMMKINTEAISKGIGKSIKDIAGVRQDESVLKSASGMGNIASLGVEGALHGAGLMTENPLFNLLAMQLTSRRRRITEAKQKVNEEGDVKNEQNNTETIKNAETNIEQNGYLNNEKLDTVIEKLEDIEHAIRGTERAREEALEDKALSNNGRNQKLLPGAVSSTAMAVGGSKKAFNGKDTTPGILENLLPDLDVTDGILGYSLYKGAKGAKAAKTAGGAAKGVKAVKGIKGLSKFGKVGKIIAAGATAISFLDDILLKGGGKAVAKGGASAVKGGVAAAKGGLSILGKTGVKATEGVAKAGGSTILKGASKGFAKVAGKGAAKGFGKSLLKKIPVIGLLAGVGFGIQRMLDGDFAGAAAEVASGAVSMIPGLGTAASIGIDAGLVARDVMNAGDAEEIKETGENKSPVIKGGEKGQAPKVASSGTAPKAQKSGAGARVGKNTKKAKSEKFTFSSHYMFENYPEKYKEFMKFKQTEGKKVFQELLKKRGGKVGLITRRKARTIANNRAIWKFREWGEVKPAPAGAATPSNLADAFENKSKITTQANNKETAAQESIKELYDDESMKFVDGKVVGSAGVNDEATKEYQNILKNSNIDKSEKNVAAVSDNGESTLSTNNSKKQITDSVLEGYQNSETAVQAQSDAEFESKNQTVVIGNSGGEKGVPGGMTPPASTPLSTITTADAGNFGMKLFGAY